jgi:hypothetical protein
VYDNSFFVFGELFVGLSFSLYIFHSMSEIRDGNILFVSTNLGSHTCVKDTCDSMDDNIYLAYGF